MVVVIVWQLYLQLRMQSVPITTNFVSSNTSSDCHDITEIMLSDSVK